MPWELHGATVPNLSGNAAMPKYKPIHVGETVDERFSGYAITYKGQPVVVSDVQYDAIHKAAHARGLTVDQFVATIVAHKSRPAAQSALREAIQRYLPAGYQWPVAVADTVRP